MIYRSLWLLLVSQAQLSSAHPHWNLQEWKAAHCIVLLWGFALWVVLLHIYMWLKPIVLSALFIIWQISCCQSYFIPLLSPWTPGKLSPYFSRGHGIQIQKLSYRPLHVSICFTKHMLFSLRVHPPSFLSSFLRFLPPSPSTSIPSSLQPAFVERLVPSLMLGSEIPWKIRQIGSLPSECTVMKVYEK